MQSPFFPRLLKNTFLLGLYSLVFGFPAPILLALLLNEIHNRPFKTVAQSITYLPHFVSVVIIVGMLYSFFGHDGYVNRILAALGIGAVDFVNDPAVVQTALCRFRSVAEHGLGLNRFPCLPGEHQSGAL